MLFSNMLSLSLSFSPPPPLLSLPLSRTSALVSPSSFSSTLSMMVPCRNMKSYSLTSISAFIFSNSWPNSLHGDARSSAPPPKTLPAIGGADDGGWRSPSRAVESDGDDDGMDARGFAKTSAGTL